MAQSQRLPLGLRLSGRFGGLELYTSRGGRLVWYREPSITQPPTPAQQEQRQRFRAAMDQWRALADQEKWALEEAARRASLPITGMNAYLSAAMAKSPDAIRALARQTGISLPVPNPV
ncbi:MAG: hypothetical protein K6T61_18075 [Bryobacteraceae bacterium]|nr:hypothetical protein [Bryobacteraceae bacterium]